jgi:hypothetical protein
LSSDALGFWYTSNNVPGAWRIGGMLDSMSIWLLTRPVILKTIKTNCINMMPTSLFHVHLESHLRKLRCSSIPKRQKLLDQQWKVYVRFCFSPLSVNNSSIG